MGAYSTRSPLWGHAGLGASLHRQVVNGLQVLVLVCVQGSREVLPPAHNNSASETCRAVSGWHSRTMKDNPISGADERRMLPLSAWEGY